MDGRADIYSLGCMFFECLTGTLPFTKDSELATVYAHLFDKPRRLSSVAPDLPAELDAPLLRALEKEPDRRFDTCYQFISAVQEAVPLGARSVAPVPPPNGGDTARPQSRTRRRWLVAAVVAVVALGVGLGMFLTRSPRTASPRRVGTSNVNPAGVPSLRGLSLSDALARLTQAGLKARHVDEPSKLIPAGQVVRTDPEAGAPVRPGQTVVVHESTGPALVFMRGGLRGSHRNCGVAANLACSFSLFMKEWGSASPPRPIFPGLSADVIYPAVSPDGSRIAYCQLQPGGNFEIFVAQFDGSHIIRLTSDPAIDIQPTWSPDGKQIAFASSRADPNQRRCPSPACRWEIYVVDAEKGGQATNISHNRYADFLPNWSTTNKIAFVSDRYGSDDIFVMNPDGTGQQDLTRDNTGTDTEPAWSSDGGRIAFSSNQGGDSDQEIWTMNADGSSTVKLTVNIQQDASPAWAPGDAEIVFTRVRPGGNREIFEMKANGQDQHPIVESPQDDGRPSF